MVPTWSISGNALDAREALWIALQTSRSRTTGEDALNASVFKICPGDLGELSPKHKSLGRGFREA